MENGTRLDSWKEIAAYLGRGVRTCQHWERNLGLPVHRLDGSSKSRVCAYAGELDVWREDREQKAPGAGRKSRRGLIFALALLAVAAAGLIVWRSGAGPGGPAAAGPAKRLVVLPFENLGAPEDGYFADGLTDEITARIASIRGIEVIGRSSATRYQKAEKTTRQIGAELGVDYILSGTVRWQRMSGGTSRVRVTPSLVRAADAGQLWAIPYDETVAEVFRVQSDIAIRVSKALNVALRRSERAELRARPTGDPMAYDDVLRGREFVRRGVQDRGNLLASIAMFEKALLADPKYVDAYASLALSHACMFWWFDRAGERAERARAAAEMAIRLGPETAEAHLALGQYYYLCRLDYDHALAELQRALARQPRNSEILSVVAYVKRRQGKLDETVSYLQSALRVDPLNAELWANFGDTYQLLRNYAESERHYRQAAALLPDILTAWISPNGSLAVLDLYGLGDTSKLRAVLERVAPNANSADEKTWLHYFWALNEICDGKYPEALDQVSLMPQGGLDSEFEFVLKEELQAQVYGLMGDREKERDLYHSSRIILAHKIGEKPDDPRYHSALGIACAGLGLKEEAVREATRATQIRPVSREFWRGIFRVRDLARVFVMVGDPDHAFDRLEYLLSISGEFSGAWLQADPVWAPLRPLPRFAALLKKAGAGS